MYTWRVDFSVLEKIFVNANIVQYFSLAANKEGTLYCNKGKY